MVPVEQTGKSQVVWQREAEVDGIRMTRFINSTASNVCVMPFNDRLNLKCPLPVVSVDSVVVVKVGK
jgi:hypothetical protein